MISRRVGGNGGNSLEIPRTDPLPHPSAFEITHQLAESLLRLLFQHRGAFDGADGGHGGFLLGGGGEGIDVVEDVDAFGDAEGGSVFRG